MEAENENEKSESSAVEKKAVLSWIRNQVVLDEQTRSLEDLRGLDARLKGYLLEEGFSECFPVQWNVWHELSGGQDFGHDLCITSPTGSGKTLAYCLPIAQALSRRSAISFHCLGAIIVLPSQSLALQVFNVAQPLFHKVNLRLEILGQRDIWAESKLLNLAVHPRDYMCNMEGLSDIDVIIATPGILCVHLQETKAITLKHLKFLVVDESDILTKAGGSFPLLAGELQKRIQQDKGQSSLLSAGPHILPHDSIFGARVLKILVSATVSHDPATFTLLDLYCPRLLAPSLAESKYSLPSGLTQYRVVCPAPLRPLVLVKLLLDFKNERTLVFTQTVETAHRVHLVLDSLDELKGRVAEYSSQLPRKLRKASLYRFRTNAIDVLIASDAMGRGMDIEDIDNIVNYDTPGHVKTYIHRIGRTARAGHMGRAYSLLRKGFDEEAFENIRDKLGKAEVQDVDLDVEELRGYKERVDAAIESMKTTIVSNKDTSRKRVRKRRT